MSGRRDTVAISRLRWALQVVPRARNPQFVRAVTRPFCRVCGKRAMQTCPHCDVACYCSFDCEARDARVHTRTCALDRRVLEATMVPMAEDDDTSTAWWAGGGGDWTRD